MHWYDDYEHFGYNLKGEKLMKADFAERGDAIDTFLKQGEDPQKAW